MGADVVFAKLWVARHWVAPEAELVCRWLLGLVLQPGTAQERAAQAAVITGQVLG